ncbi:hypothetical protein D3C73_1495590 [compost metagenome]
MKNITNGRTFIILPITMAFISAWSACLPSAASAIISRRRFLLGSCGIVCLLIMYCVIAATAARRISGILTAPPLKAVFVRSINPRNCSLNDAGLEIIA